MARGLIALDAAVIGEGRSAWGLRCSLCQGGPVSCAVLTDVSAAGRFNVKTIS